MLSQIYEGRDGKFTGPELLEVLAWKSHLMFISDLKFLDRPESATERCMVLHTLRKTRADQYPLKEWNAAVSYVAGKDVNAHTAEEARDLLIDHLSGKTIG